jgi:hypothetical protein
MGLFDRAKKLAEEHAGQVTKAIDKVAKVVDDKTGGKYADKIDKGASAAKGLVGDGDAEKTPVPGEGDAAPPAVESEADQVPVAGAAEHVAAEGDGADQAAPPPPPAPPTPSPATPTP